MNLFALIKSKSFEISAQFFRLSSAASKFLDKFPLVEEFELYEALRKILTSFESCFLLFSFSQSMVINLRLDKAIYIFILIL